MAIVLPTEVRYLIFGGGGGRGWAHIGAVEAMESLSRIPLVQGKAGKPSAQGDIRGVAGASVGAFIAMCLAFGATSTELRTLGKLFFSRKPIAYRNIFTAISSKPIPLPDDYSRVPNLLSDELIVEAGRSSSLLFQAPVVVDGNFRPWSGSGNKVLSEMVENRYYSESIEELLGLPLSTLEGVPTSRILNLLRSYWDNKLLQDRSRSAEYLRDLRIFTRDEKMFAIYLANLQGEGGVLPGRSLRHIVTSSLLRLQDLDRSGRFPKGLNVTFRELFDYSGIELAVTGTHLLRRRGELFSLRTTPDFAIVPAVCISMSLPILFKPVSVSMTPDGASQGRIMPVRYTGRWSDGGMTNNLPLRAFARPGSLDLDPRTLGFVLADPGNYQSGTTVATNLARVLREYSGVYADQPLYSQIQFESDLLNLVRILPQGLTTLHVAYDEALVGKAATSAGDSVTNYFKRKAEDTFREFSVEWGSRPETDKIVLEAAMFEAVVRAQFRTLFPLVSPAPVTIRPFINEQQGFPEKRRGFTVDVVAGSSSDPASWIFVEAKASDDAPLSGNQDWGHPLFQKFGGMLVNSRTFDDDPDHIEGEGWGPFQDGLTLPKADVIIVRPRDLWEKYKEQRDRASYPAP